LSIAAGLIIKKPKFVSLRQARASKPLFLKKYDKLFVATDDLSSSFKNPATTKMLEKSG